MCGIIIIIIIVNLARVLSSLSTKLVPIAKHDDDDDDNGRLRARYSRRGAGAASLHRSLARSLRGL